MARVTTLWQSRRMHQLAELSQRTGPQRLPATNPTVRPERLREIAATRRRDAAQRAYHLRQRPEQDDSHARWVRLEITRLLEEEADLLRQAAELDVGNAAS